MIILEISYLKVILYLRSAADELTFVSMKHADAHVAPKRQHWAGEWWKFEWCKQLDLYSVMPAMINKFRVKVVKLRQLENCSCVDDYRLRQRKTVAIRKSKDLT